MESQKEDICCDYDESNLDEKFMGKTVPSKLLTGPNEQKKCTDLLCCLIFVLLVGGIGFATFVHYPNSKIGLMTTPRDSVGNVCGVTAEVKDYPHLYMIKLSSPYRSVCVKSCPSFDYNQIRYNSTGTNSSAAPPVVSFEDFSDAVKLHNTSWDGTTKSAEIDSVDDPDLFAYDAEAAKGYYTEAQFNAYLNRNTLECRTNSNVSSCAHNPANKVYHYDSRSVLFNLCFPLAPRLLKFASFTSDLKVGFINDLKNAWWVILLSVVACVLIGGIFLLISTYFLPILVWVQIALAVVLLLALGGLGIWYAIDSKDPKFQQGLEKADAYNASVKSTAETLSKRIWLLWLISIIFILLGLYLLYSVIVSRKAISISLGVLQFSAKFIVGNLGVVVVALIAFVLQVITFVVMILGLLVLHTSGDISSTDTGSPIPQFKYTIGKWFLMIGGFVCVYWVVIFWNNLSDIICGGRASYFYFNKDTGIIKTTISVIIFHLGTVALCSLILVPCTILQLLFGWFYAMFTDDKPNFIQTIVTKVCCCLVRPYQKFINRTSEVGLTMAFFSSCNFCPSTKRNHYLAKRVEERIGSSSFISFLFKITGMIAIAALNTLAWSWLLKKTPYFQKKIENPLVPMFAIGVFGFIVAALFMSIYSTACDAFTMCLEIELDHGKSATQKDFEDISKSIKDGKQYNKL